MVDSHRNNGFTWGGRGYIKTYGLKAVQENLRDCLQVPQIYINLMEEERIDHYLFYELTVTTSCGKANILAYLMCVLALDTGYSLNVHIIFFHKSLYLMPSKMFCSAPNAGVFF